MAHDRRVFYCQLPSLHRPVSVIRFSTSANKSPLNAIAEDNPRSRNSRYIHNAMVELETDHTSTTEECIPCQELLALIDADLLEFDKAMVAARLKRLTVATVLVTLGGIVSWWLFT
jgi:hypothetical protein